MQLPTANQTRPFPADVAGNPLRLMMVHAHPDDETTTTGATAARYAAEGIGVHLVTCTRGERGEVLDERTQARISDPDPDVAAERLGRHRTGELARAARLLGFSTWRFLGAPGRWWDSGMAGEPTGRHRKALAAGDLAVQAAELAQAIREIRPQVMITYDRRGGYGHPDHIRAHQITMAAVGLAARPRPAAGRGGWIVAKVYACVVPASAVFYAADVLAAGGLEGQNPFAEVSAAVEDDPARFPFGVPDDRITARIDGRNWGSAKVAAMRAYRSQMYPNGWFFALAERAPCGVELEHYQLLHGRPARAAAPVSMAAPAEDDLFAGLRAPSIPYGAVG